MYPQNISLYLYCGQVRFVLKHMGVVQAAQMWKVQELV